MWGPQNPPNFEGKLTKCNQLSKSFLEFSNEYKNLFRVSDRQALFTSIHSNFREARTSPGLEADDDAADPKQPGHRVRRAPSKAAEWLSVLVVENSAEQNSPWSR